MTVPGFGFAQGSENSGHLPVFPHHMCLELGAWSLELLIPLWMGDGCFGSESSGEENHKAKVLTNQLFSESVPPGPRSRGLGVGGVSCFPGSNGGVMAVPFQSSFCTLLTQ